MSDQATRRLAAACGITGVLMLTAHFFIPRGVPADAAPVSQISAFVRAHRNTIFLSAWLQVTGAILYVIFILAIVHLARAGERLAGRVVALAAAILVGLTLLDSALIISAVQAAGDGHLQTLRVSFDLIGGPGNDAIGRSFLIAPAIVLALGFVMLHSSLLPRSFAYMALGFGASSQTLGLLGLFSTIAFADINPIVLALENVWLIAVAITLGVRTTSHTREFGPAPLSGHATP